MVRTLANLTRSSIAVLTVSLFACGGASKPDTLPNSGDTGQGIQPQDIAHEYETIELEGMRFVPEALELPGVAPVTVKRMPKLDVQRKKVARQKPKKPADIHVLVTLLADEAVARAKSGSPEDLEAARALRQEARTLLNEVYDAGAGSADELVVKRLAAVEAAVDEAQAVAYYEELVTRFPESESAMEYKTWLAYFLVRAGRIADAAAVVEGWDPASVSGRSAYVLAWVKYTQRDWDAANAAIAAAAVGWNGGGKPALLRDIVLLMARGGSSVADARAALTAVLPEDKPVLMTLHTYKLHEAYLYAGHYALASEALDAAMEAAAPADRVTFRYNQADFAFRLGQPGLAATRIEEAIKACSEWAECPEATRNVVAERILLLARVYHNTYASTLDDAYGQAAKALYTTYLGLQPARADAEEVAGNLKNLDDHMQNAQPAMGKHTKDAMKHFLMARAESINACYEAVLAGTPDLMGTVRVTLDVSQDGQVEAVATKPGPGEEGLAAVAGCITERTKDWRFPGRSVPGLTRLVVPYAFKAKAEAHAPAPGEPAGEGAEAGQPEAAPAGS
jgi:tetratricopeptide (TPR) repeat protein